MKPGELLDERYEVVRELGDGGMGAVYEAVNKRIQKRVAIKVLHPHSRDEEMMVRFEQEARAAARVGSSHIVDVLDLGDLPDGRNYIVMEYLDGESLAARLERQPTMDPREVASIAIQLLDGLAMVHAEGIVHRDLKPANVFLVPNEGKDFVKILDFGVCKISGEGRASVTQPGSVLGTPSYMAPEQIETKDIDGRADLYAVGVMMYRAVTGQTPFQGATIHQLIAKIIGGQGESISDAAPDLEEDFAAIIEKAIQKRPKDRYPDAAAFRADLVTWFAKHKRVDRLLADFLGTPDEAFEPIVPVAPPRAPARAKKESTKEPKSGTTKAAAEKTEPVKSETVKMSTPVEIRYEPSLREASKRIDLRVGESSAPEDDEEEPEEAERKARLAAATEAGPPEKNDDPFEHAKTRRYAPNEKQKRLLLMGAGGLGGIVAISLIAGALGGDPPASVVRPRHERVASIEGIDGTIRARSVRPHPTDERPPDEPKKKPPRRR